MLFSGALTEPQIVWLVGSLARPALDAYLRWAQLSAEQLVQDVPVVEGDKQGLRDALDNSVCAVFCMLDRFHDACGGHTGGTPSPGEIFSTRFECIFSTSPPVTSVT